MTEPLKAAWKPQEGPQTRFLQCPFGDIFFGGAAGGGKSDGVLGHFIKHWKEEGFGAKGILFRRFAPDLEDITARAREMFTAAEGGRNGWLEKKQKWVFADGAELRFRALERDADVNKYLSQAFSWMCFEEMPTWANPGPIMKMRSRIRSVHTKKTWFVATGNPGCVGHGWVKQLYIDPSPPGVPFLPPELRERGYAEEELKGQERVFIPSKLENNQILMENDPDYAMRLEMIGSEELVKAWRHGDWSVTLGTYFTEFSEFDHVIATHDIPAHWVKFRCLDWGSKTPFAVLWIAVSDGTPIPGSDITLPEGALVVYREWYGVAGSHGALNVGLGLTSDEVAKGIFRREDERIDYSVADYEIFAKRLGQNGPTINEGFQNNGIFWMAANKDRLAGWHQIRMRLKGHGWKTEQWQPMLYVMDRCKQLIRTLPLLQHEDNTEDAQKGGEDHLPEALRYGCMSRMFTRHMKERVNRDILNADKLTWNDWTRRADQQDRQYKRLKAF